MHTFEEAFDEVAPVISGISPDEAIKRYIELDKRVKEADYERSQYKTFLIEQARAQQAGQNTVHLESANGLRIKCEFKKRNSCDQDELECARDLLTDQRFMKLFKYTFTPKSRELKTFLNTVFSDEKLSTAQAIIKEAIKEVDAQPYLTIEKG